RSSSTPRSARPSRSAASNWSRCATPSPTEATTAGRTPSGVRPRGLDPFRIAAEAGGWDGRLRSGGGVMPKGLILTGDGAEDLEVMYPYQRLLEEGYDVDVAAPAVKKLQFVVHDFVDGFDTYTEKLGHTWPADLAFADVDPSDYVAVVIPGGRAPEYIRNDP